MKYSKKNEFIKEGWGVPLLNFEGGPGILLLNFEGGPGVSLLNFEGGPEVLTPGVLVPLLHHAHVSNKLLWFSWSIYMVAK